MKLRPDVDVVDLMRRVARCEGDVFFDTSDGDHLNLKSALCQYVFGVLAEDSDSMENGLLTCENEADMAIFSGCLRET